MCVKRNEYLSYNLIMTRTALLVMTLGAVLTAQTTGNRTVQSNGSATITANPDQAQIDIGVVTVGATRGLDSGTAKRDPDHRRPQAPSRRSWARNGTTQTVSYYVSPRYTNTSPQVINGYTTSNTLRVVTQDLSIIGQLIDGANQAGANSVSSLSFGLQNPEPLVQQALTQATKQAMAHANAIATGLGGKIASVISGAGGRSSYAPIRGQLGGWPARRRL